MYVQDNGRLDIFDLLEKINDEPIKFMVAISG